MADPTNPTSGQGDGSTGGSGSPLPALPPMPVDGAEVYDQIMGAIEPDLTNAQRPLLIEKYKDETPEQTQVRMERYNQAFAEYEKQYKAYRVKRDGEMRSFENTLRKSVEKSATSDETNALQNLESQFNTPDTPAA